MYENELLKRVNERMSGRVKQWTKQVNEQNLCKRVPDQLIILINFIYSNKI